MGTIKEHYKVKLVMGLIWSDNFYLENVKKILEKKFGFIDSESEVVKFDFTDYYYNEMGDTLWRKLISFKKLIIPSLLPDIKIFTNKIESKFLNEYGGRKVNLDPGYITLAKLVLATTKDFAHRIYLEKGIYAEITLKYTKKSFIPLEWTYPDYKEQFCLEFFNKVRDVYKRQIDFSKTLMNVEKIAR